MSHNLKYLLLDGYTALEGKSDAVNAIFNKQDLTTVIPMLEEIVEKAEEKLVEIYSLTDSKALSKFEQLKHFCLALPPISNKLKRYTHTQYKLGQIKLIKFRSILHAKKA